MKNTVTMILKGATRVISYSKDGVNRSIVGFTRLDSVELDGKNVLPKIMAPLAIVNGSAYAQLDALGSAVEIKDCANDELALQIEIEDEFHPEWMSFYVVDFKSAEMSLVDGVWYMAGGKEENLEWYDNLSAPIITTP